MEVKDSGGELGRSAETIFHPGTVAIATHTLYPQWYAGRLRNIGDTDKVRGDLALKTLKAAIDNGFHLILADGGSSSEFLAEVSNLEKQGVILITTSESGRGPQRRAAFTRASREMGVQVIVYTQPEKVLLIQRYVREIASPILRGEADIVIPARDPELFQSSYPGYMYKSEVLVNKRYNQILEGCGILKAGQEFDWFFGSVVFKNDPVILELFLKKYQFVKPQSKENIDRHADPESRSNAHYFPVIEALYRGLKVISIEVPFVYPYLQKENETAPATRKSFEERRKTDKFGYWAELVQMVRYLRGDPKAKIGLQEDKSH